MSTCGSLLSYLPNDLLTREIDVQLANVNFHSQDSFAVNTTSRRERLDTPFTHGVCDRGWVAGRAGRREL